MIQSFESVVAEEFGMAAAVIFNHIGYWWDYNVDQEKNFKDGRYWTYDTVKTYQKKFPYLTERQIRIAIQSLIDGGMLLKGCFNSDPHDRTTWYSLTEKGEAVWKNSRLRDVIRENGSYAHVTSEVTPTSHRSDADVNCTYTHKDITHNDTDYVDDFAKSSSRALRKTKKAYGEFQNVKLTDAEYSRLVNDYGEDTTMEAIKFLDEYLEEKPGYKTKSHNLTLRRWVFNAVKERKAKPAKASGDYDWENL